MSKTNLPGEESRANQKKGIPVSRLKEKNELDLLLNEINEVSPAIIYIYDVRTNINIYSNKALAKFLGYNKSDLQNMGNRMLEFIIHPEDVEGYRQHVADLISAKTNNSSYFELRARTKTGGYVWTSIKEKVFQRDTSGHVESIIGIANDIDEQKKEQFKLEEALSELENIAFISSHDLKEPINSINCFSQLLKNRYSDKLDEDALVFLNFISEASNRMMELVNSMLTYSRIGKDLEKSVVDCNDMVIHILQDLSFLIDEHDAQIEVGKLPILMAYKLELRRLFQNLFSNAIKYSKPKQKSKISISTIREQDNWIFSVQDNGIGIDMKYKDSVFDLFKRLHSSVEFKGSGIGLAQCKKIVQLHNGSIWLESEPGKGSTFHFSIPANL